MPPKYAGASKQFLAHLPEADFLFKTKTDCHHDTDPKLHFTLHPPNPTSTLPTIPPVY